MEPRPMLDGGRLHLTPPTLLRHRQRNPWNWNQDIYRHKSSHGHQTPSILSGLLEQCARLEWSIYQQIDEHQSFWLVVEQYSPKWQHADTKQETNFDKLYKVRPFIDALQKNFLKCYDPDDVMSVDESVILIRGRSSLKQYRVFQKDLNDKNTVPWGIPHYHWSNMASNTFEHISSLNLEHAKLLYITTARWQAD